MVCLFVWGFFSPHSRIFHLLEDVIIDGEELQILTYARDSWQWGIFDVPYLLRHSPTLINGYLQGHTCCRAFGSESVTNCCNDLGQFRPGIEPRPSACEANARHRSNNMMRYGVFEKDKFGITVKYLTHYNAHVMKQKECYCR